ncbi:SufE family protein [uncultured Rubinisphaera sp.]|uniref:SufE family protein n=1 Tax=uncultured Rubinisphaera sp. TaxID=1678686 RepID=UPI000EC2522D|nr:Fe-S cluster assembly protein SufE [Planctomycetaceae bacterium]|tara:strand:+ start:173 stop:628 length:456 start_codon:yes stop_codon:yes gene_type:complete
MIDRTDNNTDQITLAEIFDEFEFLGDSEAQMDYLIDLGLDLPKLPAEEKTELNRVHGCQSNVWMLTNFDDEVSSPLHLQAESDAMIVNGLIAVLLAAYQEKRPKEILDIEIHKIFDRLGLDRHLSPQRKNGLNGMVKRIREAAMVKLSQEG